MGAHSPDAIDLPAVQPGALRIFARRDDSEILITDGDEREVGPGERMVHTEALASAEVATAMSHFCSGRLIMCRFPPDADGWHRFAVAHLRTLLADARTNLNVTYFPPPAEPRERQDWTKKRCAWLGLRAGQGWTAQAIAGEPMIRATEGAVHKQAQRLDISLSTRPHGQAILRLPASVLAAYEAEAARQGLTRDALMARQLIAGSRNIAA